MNFKKIFLVLGIIVVLFIGFSYFKYKGQVEEMRADPKKFYTQALLKDHGFTELHKASYNGDLDEVSEIFEKSQDIHAKTLSLKFTPFHTSIIKGHVEVADFLLSNGANIDEGSNFDQTPLHWASFVGDIEVVEFLIEKGASLEKLSQQGWTALHYAALMGHLDVVKLLIDKGVILDKKNDQGQTAKDLAQLNKKEDVVEFLSSTN